MYISMLEGPETNVNGGKETLGQKPEFQVTLAGTGDSEDAWQRRGGSGER